VITNKKHNKHTKLVRPTCGTFSRCEVGILGATCDRIKSLVQIIAEQLSTDAKVYYIDADHDEQHIPSYTSLTDGINHHRLSFDKKISIYDQKSLLADSDISIINANHFEASSQIVLCTAKKRESLSRKLDRLTDIKLILLDDGVDAPFDYLQEIITTQDPIIASIHNTDIITQVIEELYELSKPKINALIMAGGKSQRMGEDKSMINYHGSAQWEHIAELTSSLGLSTYISCRADQRETFGDHQVIEDTFYDLGPYGALLSAFRSDPNAAWLSIACDLPLLTEVHIKRLIDEVSYKATATSYHNPTTGWPEPMATIWMPRAYPTLLKYLGLGYSCPRKVLINTPVHEIQVDDASFLHNANTPEDKLEAIKKLK